MKKVIIESPYSGDIQANEIYLSECLADSLKRGEAPFASHGLYTRPGVLDDSKHAERMKGIRSGFAWRSAADKTVFYIDQGFSEGMAEGLTDAMYIGHPIEFRAIKKGQNNIARANKAIAEALAGLRVVSEVRS